MNPASGICLMKRRQYSLPHSETKCARRPLQGGGLAKHDAVIEDAWLSVEGQSPDQVQDNEDRGSASHFENDFGMRFPQTRRLKQ
jgi:hypothetical protein